MVKNSVEKLFHLAIVVRDGANALQADALRILVALDRHELNSHHAAVDTHWTHRHALVKVFRTVMAEEKIIFYSFLVAETHVVWSAHLLGRVSGMTCRDSWTGRSSLSREAPESTTSLMETTRRVCSYGASSPGRRCEPNSTPM
jgi:hypothetical protein